MTTKKVNQNIVASKNTAKRTVGRTFYFASRNEQVASFGVERVSGFAPKVVSPFKVQHCSELNLEDTTCMSILLACKKINEMIEAQKNGYIHFYTTKNVVLKFREIISHRNDDEETMLAALKKDWMSTQQVAITELFAKTIRKAAETTLLVSFKDFRELNFLEFKNLKNKKVKAGDKIAFVNGENPNFETYGLKVNGTFPVVSSTRTGEEDKLLLDIRGYGNPNNPNSFLAFSRKVVARLNEELSKDNSWDALLDTIGTSSDTSTSYEAEDTFDDVPFC